jgi:hypothetical protein
MFNGEEDIQDQGFLAHTSDCVLATNVIHALIHLTLALRTVHDLLSMCAYLVFNELSESTSLEDLTFGLTDGWWRFVDKEIRQSALLRS